MYVGALPNCTMQRAPPVPDYLRAANWEIYPSCPPQASDGNILNGWSGVGYTRTSTMAHTGSLQHGGGFLDMALLIWKQCPAVPYLMKPLPVIHLGLMIGLPALSVKPGATNSSSPLALFTSIPAAPKPSQAPCNPHIRLTPMLKILLVVI